MGSNTKFRFENLDSIRTIAFFSTFLAHAFYSESDEVLNSGGFQFAIALREYFSFGVPVFFVLSGFLITYLMLKEQTEFNSFSLKNFYMRRILRIWPVYFSVLLIGFIGFPLLYDVLLKLDYVETANPIYYITFLSNFDQINSNALPFGVGLGPTWSVSIEEQYYLIWPVLILFFKRTKFILPIIITIIGSIVFTSLFNLSNKHTIYCMLYLATGSLYAYLAFYYKEVVKRITNINSIVFVGILVALSFLIYVATNKVSHIGLIALIAILIGYIIIFQCYSGKFQFKKIPYLEFWGKYTYGLYLYHVTCNFIIHIIIDDLFSVEESEFGALLLKPSLSLGLSLVLSYLSYHYFESFFLKLKDSFTNKKDI